MINPERSLGSNQVALGGIAPCAEVIGNIHDNPELLKGGAQ